MQKNELLELPTGWVVTRLGNIVHPSNEKVDPLVVQETHYVGLEHIEKDTGKLLGYGESNEVKSTKSKFSAGDLLYGKLRPYLNKVHLVNFDGVCSTDILVFSKTHYISNEYLAFRFLCRDFVNYTSQNVNGVQHPRVNFQTLAEFPIALPPLNEQRRIVAKIEALMARSQRVKEALEAIPPLLDQFRQSVLAAAFRGDLTAEWREKNPDVEPASKLISLLKTPYPELELDVFEKSADYELPSSWMWVPLGKLGSLTGGGTPSKDNPNFWNGHIPWISPKDMKRDRISDSIDHISEEALSHSSVKKVSKGSLLFVVRGMILNHSFPTAITDTVVTVNQDIKALIPEVTQMNEYLLIASKFISNKILFWVKAATHGTRRLETQILKNWAIPIPPLEEQKELIQRVDTLLLTASKIEQQYQQVRAYLDQLDQSILAKAFRGELVPQDPNDEPASVLLERIRAEREKADKTKKANGKCIGKGSRKAKAEVAASEQLSMPGLE